MNIKSLLLGSAAALVAVSGARAADAIIIAEPEPVEYVRVCDTYGAGYFYIPGTDTCMRVGGYVRVNIAAGDNVGANSRYATAGYGTLGTALVGTDGGYSIVPATLNTRTALSTSAIDNDTYGWLTRGLVRIQTAAETEYGLLRTDIELEANHRDGRDGGTILAKGIIDLGGFSIGSHDSRFWTWTNGTNDVLSDDIMSSGPGNRTNFISYTFASDNGLSAMIGVEQGRASGDSYFGVTRVRNNAGTPVYYDNTSTTAAGWLTDDYSLHVVGGVKYEQGWGGLSAVVAYDTKDEEWAGKIRLDVNATDNLSLFTMVGFTSRDQTYDFDGRRVNGLGATDLHYVYRTHPSYYGDWGGDWAVWAGGQYRFNEDRTRFNLLLGYDDLDTFAAVANVSHDIVSGLTLTTELAYKSWDNDFGYDTVYTGSTVTRVGVRDSLRGQDAFQGIVRLQRSF